LNISGAWPTRQTRPPGCPRACSPYHTSTIRVTCKRSGWSSIHRRPPGDQAASYCTKPDL
jgi:hypothetical protein